MFELLASVHDLQQKISWTRDAQSSGCMATASNWNCVIEPSQGNYGTYEGDNRKDSVMQPAGDYVYWEHSACTLDMDNGVCR
mmetsp:Transcript_1065/g.1758  ORF Transcript_1065/g.1758 Transcript_1065/m.1758 type:complete len:82 (+) Transcript_1065:3-248(+)